MMTTTRRRNNTTQERRSVYHKLLREDSRIRKFSNNLGSSKSNLNPGAPLAKDWLEFYQPTHGINNHVTFADVHLYKTRRPTTGNSEALLYKPSSHLKKVRFDEEIHQQLFDKLYELIKHSDTDFIDLNKYTFRIAGYLNNLLAKLSVRPSKMAKSLEGSLIFEFRRIDYFASIEIFNDEDIVFLEKTPDGIVAEDLDFKQLRSFTNRIAKQIT